MSTQNTHSRLSESHLLVNPSLLNYCSDIKMCDPDIEQGGQQRPAPNEECNCGLSFKQSLAILGLAGVVIYVLVYTRGSPPSM